MKNINTLVPDIYRLLESGLAKIDTLKLSEMLSSRLSATKGGDVLRASSVGEKCTRKLWYRQHLPECAEPIPGHTRIKFTVGDILDDYIPALAKAAGHSVEAEQEEVELYGVKGHVDCIIDGVVVDVKSANSRSMEKFRKNRLLWDDPFGYLDQIGFYAEALKGDPRVTSRDEVAFLACDKELGHLVLDRYPRRDKPWREIIASLDAAIKKEEPPPRAYEDVPEGKSGNKQLCMECRYCAFKQECWKDSNGNKGLRQFIYAKGPMWLTKIMRQPNVLEDSKVEQSTS